MRATAVLVAGAAALLLSGCFSEILPTGPATKLEFLCQVLDADEAEDVVIDSWVGDGFALDVDDALQALVGQLGQVGTRPDGDGKVTVDQHGDPETPKGGWDADTLRDWQRSRRGTLADEVHLHVFWVAELDGAVFLEPAPGLVAIAQDAVHAGAGRLGHSDDDVLTAVLLHAVGHALGEVNQGVPVQDAAIGSREGPPGHDPDPASVMHAGWEDATTMAWAGNATYDAYGPALLADWAAAVQPGGVCAS